MSSNDDELPDADGEGRRRGTDTDARSRFNSAGSPSANFLGRTDRVVTLIHDSANWLSVIRNLRPTDVIVLLTPVVIPVSQDPVDTADPFECFGRALASRHPRIRHVPYTNTNGITSTHVGFVKRATVVIFVMSEISRSGDSPQIQAAHVTQALTHERPLLIVLTCNSQDPLQFAKDFPTIIQSKDYSRPTLELTASLIFGEHVEADSAGSRLTTAEGPQPKLWPVEQWNESRDINSVHYLWVQSMDVRFELPVSSLASLLRRPGYARHYVVRDTSGQLLGFCATYLSYVDQAGEKLIASLAILLVRSDHQRRGIGLSLHNHAIDQLKRTRGVARLQLGSTFPRILYGPTFNMQLDQGWFSRRGWRMDRDYPGQGKSVHDLILDFDDWNYSGQDRTTQFRNCTQQDMAKVLGVVEEETAREHNMGWFDQYSRLINDINVRDIVVAVEENFVVAVALTYTPSCGSPVASDLPWAGRIGGEVGGVTCICIPLPRRDRIMVPLLNACVKKLQEQGMRKMFLDGVVNHLESFKQLGFREWARYRDVWRDL